MTQDLQPQPSGAVVPFEQIEGALGQLLEHLGLPIAAVLVPIAERKNLVNAMPIIAEKLGEVRGTSIYVSKFVAACVAGLFDAALNLRGTDREVTVQLTPPARRRAALEHQTTELADDFTALLRREVRSDR